MKENISIGLSRFEKLEKFLKYLNAGITITIDDSTYAFDTEDRLGVCFTVISESGDDVTTDKILLIDYSYNMLLELMDKWDNTSFADAAARYVLGNVDKKTD